MRIIFAGTPEFARVALVRLIESGHDVVAVLTQPDRPAGRGMKLTPSPVKKEALNRGLSVLQPQTLKHPVIQEQLKSLKAELMVVAAYGLILPQAVLDTPRLGCVNIHASLLPRWRGAAPIQRAIESGDEESGISIMQMDIGLDTGDVLLKEALPLAADETAQTLHDKLAELGGELIVYALQRLEKGLLTPTPQPSSGITYAEKISKEEAEIDWTLPAKTVDRRIRAFNPFPGAYTAWSGNIVKIWSAEVVARQGEPGTVLQANDSGLVIACGKDALKITEIQQAGGKRLSAQAFLVGHALTPGISLGATEKA